MSWIEKRIESFVKNIEVPAEEIPILTYGLRQGFKSIVGFCLAVFLGIIMKIPLLSILFSICYIAQRIYAGGYHADSEKGCAALSLFSVMMAYTLIKFGPENRILIFCMSIISFAILCMFSPVENPRHLLNSAEKCHFKKCAIVIATIIFGGSVVAVFLEFYLLARSLMAALLLSATNVLVGYIKYKSVKRVD